MPFKEETIAGTHLGEPYSFATNNRRRVSRKNARTGKREVVEVFMSDAEFDAHKAEQKANMEKGIQRRQKEQADKVIRDRAEQKLRDPANKDRPVGEVLTVEEFRKLQRIE